MFRFLALLAVTLMAQTPVHAGVEKRAEPAESRQKIIDQIKTEFDQVRDRLNADDPGAEVRAGQDRILKGLDELLKQKDPSQSKNPPPSSSAPPPGSSEPKPQPAASEPMPMTQAKPQPAATQAKTGEVKKAAPPNTPDEVRKATKSGRWGEMPPRHGAAIDAVGRARFVPSYQEILREYYRNLAQSSRNAND
jgi:hypothetical protein